MFVSLGYGSYEEAVDYSPRAVLISEIVTLLFSRCAPSILFGLDCSVFFNRRHADNLLGVYRANSLNNTDFNLGTSNAIRACS